MKKYLYLIDLDDTLVENGKALKDDTIKMMNEVLEDESKELIISSARNYSNIKRRTIGLNKNIKIISRNGSMIHDDNGRIIYADFIKPENVSGIVKYCIDNQLCPALITVVGNEEKVFCYKEFLNEECYENYKIKGIEYIEDYKDFDFSNVSNILAWGNIDSEKVYELNDFKIKKYEKFLQITNVGVGKDSALRYFKAKDEYSKITSFGNDDNGFHFMNNDDFSQVYLNKELIDNSQFMKAGDEVKILFRASDEVALAAELPNTVIMEITYTEPGLKGIDNSFFHIIQIAIEC